MVADGSGSKSPSLTSQLAHAGNLQATGFKSEWPGAAVNTLNMGMLTSLANGVKGI